MYQHILQLQFDDDDDDDDDDAGDDDDDADDDDNTNGSLLKPTFHFPEEQVQNVFLQSVHFSLNQKFFRQGE